MAIDSTTMKIGAEGDNDDGNEEKKMIEKNVCERWRYESVAAAVKNDNDQLQIMNKTPTRRCLCLFVFILFLWTCNMKNGRELYFSTLFVCLLSFFSSLWKQKKKYEEKLFLWVH